MRRIVKQKKKSKSIMIMSICFAVTFVCVGVCGLIFMLSTRSETRYNRLVNNITKVSKSNVKQIQNDLTSLSSTYKNVGELKKQYEEIEYEIRFIESYADQITKLTEDFCTKIRMYYDSIYEFDKANKNWDLTQYLNEINIIQLIFGKYWTRNIETTNSMYFTWYEDTDNSGTMTLRTNVPNNIESTKQYTYSVKYKPEESNSAIISYTNKC